MLQFKLEAVIKTSLRQNLQAILALVMVFSFSCCQRTMSATDTGFEGAITISPAHPGPTREGISNSAPLTNALFDVANEKEVISSFTTDEKGRFRVLLAPGHYTVRVKGRIRRCGPFDVQVASGKMTKVEWGCDSGMR
ncbi:MAG TPA: carboxypeptidase-like regulatory domain-containing protein [Chthoniobacterales bacterium]